MGAQAEPAFNFAHDVVRRWAQLRPHDIALWCVDDAGGERKYSFAELNDQFRRATHLFHQAGIRRGDRVLVMLPRIPMWWIGMLGLIRLGAVPIPSTVLLTSKDIAYRVETAGIKAVLTDAEGAGKMGSFKGIALLVEEVERDLDKVVPDFYPESTLATDPGLIFFTSGTTGPPKMVLHTQESYGLGHRLTGEQWLCCQPQDVHWNMADTGWAKAAWSSLFGPWHMGSCIFSIDARGKFDPTAALQTLARYPITTWCAPPTALRLLVREDLGAFRFPRLRHCVSAGEPLNPEVIDTWKAATGLTIYEGYGQTETIVIIANLRTRGDEVQPGSMGRPVPGYEIALLDEDLHPVPSGEEGEIAVRVAPHRPVGIFREYWQRPDENAARFRGDWYLTSDRAVCDADGRYWFVGRSDDVIKSSGYRIGPFEVESALIEHPAVLEAAVVARPDEMRGSIVRAFVVLRKNYRPCDEMRHELQEHCKRVTAPYKYPREIEFLPELPKTISGKIRRVELRARG
ncbi:acetyl-CoA synthetase/medium-chain acyl-CoA synthetase [Chthoniobacter flavus]|uniref:AMP-binding protein n=2 Tax=Chthoniobacter flavus TaxID=191863 RepID=UPI00105378AE|nr:AMP-binding protein [Chthoniobacter flavus]TCO87392.1 acetyl-CoA synthetase/medium-chain acyl-CoA synthetase [Chthoniobacter flavus]